MATSHGLALGPGPRPTTGDEFAARMRAAAASAVGTVSLAGVEILGLERAGIDAALDDEHIDSLEIDLTGVDITLPDDDDDDAGDAAADADAGSPAPETRRTDAVLRSATVSAHPAALAGVPVELDLTLDRVPFVWVERADGSLELDASDDAEALRRASADLSISVAQPDLAALVTTIVNVAIADVGASVTGLEIALTGAGADVADLDATAKVRYGVVGAKVRLRATASIVDGHRIRLSGLDLSTGNLLAGALLGLARGELEKLEGREFDLAEVLPVELGAIEAHLDVTDETVTLRATVGR